jgi:hypothetical protein
MATDGGARLACASYRGPPGCGYFGPLGQESRASLYFYTFNPGFYSHLYDVGRIAMEGGPQGVGLFRASGMLRGKR